MFDDKKNKVTFRRCQFNNIKFLGSDKTTNFEECTFVLYDSKSTVKTAVEIQKSNLDKASLDDLKKNVEYYANLS